MASSNNRDSNETDRTTIVMQMVTVPWGQSYKINKDKVGDKWFYAEGIAQSTYELL